MSSSICHLSVVAGFPQTKEAQMSFMTQPQKSQSFISVTLFTQLNLIQYRRGLHKGMNNWIQKYWRLFQKEATKTSISIYLLTYLPAYLTSIYWNLCVYTGPSKFNPTSQDSSQLVLGSEDADPHHSYSPNISTYFINTHIRNQSPGPMPSNSDTMYKYPLHQAFGEKEMATPSGILV